MSPARPAAPRRFSHVVGFDDGPFAPSHRGDVLVIGAVYAGTRLEGVLSSKVRRDGANATRVLAAMVRGSRFSPQLQLVLLQGIALAGFNVVDLHGLHEATGVPVLAVARRRPDMAAIERALRERVPGGLRKWRLLAGLGPMEPAAGLHVQRAGITLREAQQVLARLGVSSALPEPLRTAHLIAGGVSAGESRHRA